jgi:hypothetical protein
VVVVVVVVSGTNAIPPLLPLPNRRNDINYVSAYVRLTKHKCKYINPI